MLRGLPPRQTRANMEAIVAELDRHGIKVLIAGMIAAPNLGPEYGTKFNRISPDLAGTFVADLYPFFLAKVVGERKHLLPHGVHTNFQEIGRAHHRTQVTNANI